MMAAQGCPYKVIITMSETLNIFAHTDTRYTAGDVLAFEGRVASGEFGTFQPCVVGQRVSVKLDGLSGNSRRRIGVPSSCCYFNLCGFSQKLTAVERFISEIEALFETGIGDGLRWCINLNVREDGDSVGIVRIKGEGSVDPLTVYAIGDFAPFERPIFDVLNLEVGALIGGAQVKAGKQDHVRIVEGRGGAAKLWSVVMGSPLVEMDIRSHLDLDSGFLDEEQILDHRLISGCVRLVDRGVFQEGVDLRFDTLVEESLQDWLSEREGDASSCSFKIGRLEDGGGDAELHVRHEDGGFSLVAFGSQLGGNAGSGVFRLFEEYGFQA